MSSLSFKAPFHAPFAIIFCRAMGTPVEPPKNSKENNNNDDKPQWPVLSHLNHAMDATKARTCQSIQLIFEGCGRGRGVHIHLILLLSPFHLNFHHDYVMNYTMNSAATKQIPDTSNIGKAGFTCKWPGRCLTLHTANDNTGNTDEFQPKTIQSKGVKGE